MVEMFGISVIIPTYNDDDALAALLENLSKHDIAEIIVSNAEYRSLPRQILQKTGDVPVVYIPSEKGRGPQIATAIAASSQPILWILHADSLPHPDSCELIRDILAKPRNMLGCFPLSFSQSSPWLRLFSFFSRFDSPLTTFGDQGYFFRRSDYEALRIDLAAYPLLEDVVLRRALKSCGRVRKAPAPITTSARRFRQYGYLRTQWRNLDILWRYWRGENPRALYRRYYGATPRTAPAPPPSSTAHRV